MKAPCKDCVDRFIGCHAECKRYLEYKEHNEKAKEDQRRFTASADTILTLPYARTKHSVGIKALSENRKKGR